MGVLKSQTEEKKKKKSLEFLRNIADWKGIQGRSS